MFAAQLKLMLNKKSFQISFTIMMLAACGLPAYYAVSNLMAGNDISHVVSKQYAYIFNANSPIAEYISYLIPIIAMLPFSTSFMTESKLNYCPLMISRGGIKNYYFAKALCCGLGGFAVFFIPAVINIIINQLFLPFSNVVVFYQSFADMLFHYYNPARSLLKFNPEFTMITLFVEHPQIYNLMMALIMGFLCAVFALVAYAVSFCLKKYAYLSALPMMMVILLGEKYRALCLSRVIPIEKFINLSMTDYAITESMEGKSYLLFFAICAVLIVGSLFVIYKKARVHI
ncbi:MAG: hypothetical protein FWG90_09545 [Oscillospiraceae bacterium]|nr:hypothetical protein [Oscillospiraceae bacterium]